MKKDITKGMIVFVLVLVALSLSAAPAFASVPLVSEVDTAMQGLITIVRQLALVGAVALIVFIGVSMMFGGSSQNIAQYKVQAILLILALLLIFRAEGIVGALQAIFGFS